MTKINILHWLYKHSPLNFYSITQNNETVIKSINNTFVGYKFDRVFSDEDINSLRKIIKNFKRFSTIAVLLAYIILIYCFIFPHYDLFNNQWVKYGTIVFAILLPFLVLALISKFFELYLNKKFGEFTKAHFPSSDVIENQSYKDFKLEIVKIFILLVVITGIYFCIGSPYQTSLNLINQGKYSDAVKMTTIWSKILPIDARWYSLRAYAKFYDGDYKGAIEDYDKSYKLKDDEYKSMSFDNKIYIKYILNDYESALKDFDNEIKNTRDDNEKDSLLWDKAQFLYNIGKYKTALSIYNELIDKSEEDRVYLLENRLYYERSQVYKRLKMDKEALADEQKAQELDLDIEYQTSIPEPTLILEEI